MTCVISKKQKPAFHSRFLFAQILPVQGSCNYFLLVAEICFGAGGHPAIRTPSCREIKDALLLPDLIAFSMSNIYPSVAYLRSGCPHSEYWLCSRTCDGTILNVYVANITGTFLVPL